MRVIDNIIIYDKYKDMLSDLKDNVQLIASKTVDTWQVNRSKKERLNNTMQGKQAEVIIQNHIISATDYVYLSYDEFRNNHYEKHAPVDGLLFKSNTPESFINKCIDLIRLEVSNNSYGIIKPETRNYVRESGIFTAEVKSTKVSEKKRKMSMRAQENCDIEKHLIQEIRKDDYLTYPHAIRHSNIRSSAEYLSLLNNKGFINSKGNNKEAYNEMKAFELPHMCDIYFRIYLDTINEVAYIMGFITRYDFFSIYPPTIKKMVLPGKSEGAIYLSLPIMKGKNINDLSSTMSIYVNERNANL